MGMEADAGPSPRDPDCLAPTVDIVAAFVGRNPMSASDLPELIATVHAALRRLAAPAGQVRALRPAVPVRRSIQPDFLVCLEDGRTFKSLKRHLRSRYDLSPEQYRAKWDLPPDYPMVAPNYAAVRAALARITGLGQRRRRNELHRTATVHSFPRRD